MNARIIDLGFSVADGGGLCTTFDKGLLVGTFTDWRKRRIRFLCHHTIAYRWQLAESSLLSDERYDSVHEIDDSDWLKLHEAQGYLDSGRSYHHYKMNFNAEGIFEIICANVEIQK